MLAANSRAGTVIVTYGKHSKTLAVVRSLGQSGRNVVLTDDERFPLCSFSKYCYKSLLTRNPKRDPRGFVDDLDAISQKWQAGLIIPMDDMDCDAFVTKGTGELHCRVALTDPKGYAVARSKSETNKLAERIGVASPRTVLVERTDDVASIRDTLGFPAIVKPVHGSGSRGFRIIRSEQDIADVELVMGRYGPVVGQEFIPNGGSVGVSILMNHGELRAKFTHRRLVEFPPVGGPSVVRQSIEHPEAEEAAKRLLEELKWHGVAMVEFRIDARTGRAVLMEINPRFWGSLQLAITSGVDFPKLLVDMYEKGDVVPTKGYRKGVTCVKILPAGVASFLGDGGSRRAVRTIRHALDAQCFDVESVHDPMPTIGAALTLMRSALSKSRVDEFYTRGE